MSVGGVSYVLFECRFSRVCHRRNTPCIGINCNEQKHFEHDVDRTFRSGLPAGFAPGISSIPPALPDFMLVSRLHRYVVSGFADTGALRVCVGMYTHS